MSGDEATGWIVYLWMFSLMFIAGLVGACATNWQFGFTVLFWVSLPLFGGVLFAWILRLVYLAGRNA